MNLDKESLNKLHLEAIARARETGSEADWQDAQSIEHTIKEYEKVQQHYKDLGRRLGVLESFASMMLQEHGGSAACNLFKEIAPDIYVELLEARRGHQSTGV